MRLVRIPREKRRGSKIKASLSRAPKRLKLRVRVQGSIPDANEGLQFCYAPFMLSSACSRINNR